MISQIAAAANVWNNVGTSSHSAGLWRLLQPGTTESAPGIQIEFSDDIPPGLLAMSIPTVVGGLAIDPNGTIPSDLSFAHAVAERHEPATSTGPAIAKSFL